MTGASTGGHLEVRALHGRVALVLPRFLLLARQGNPLEVWRHLHGYHGDVLVHRRPGFPSVGAVGGVQRVALLALALRPRLVQREEFLLRLLRLPDRGPLVPREETGRGDAGLLVRLGLVVRPGSRETG
eukprot:9492465-Pyramimonas_sp.AAC.2